MKKTRFFFTLFVMFFLLSCQQGERHAVDEPPDMDAELAALLDHHNRQREAHINYDVDLILELTADEVINLDSGQEFTSSREEIRAQFQQYFNGVRFEEWDDIEPPEFKISRDGTLAVAIVQKRLSVRNKQEGVDSPVVTTEFAWLAVLEKIDGKWKATAFATTRKPVDAQ